MRKRKKSNLKKKNNGTIERMKKERAGKRDGKQVEESGEGNKEKKEVAEINKR